MTRETPLRAALAATFLAGLSACVAASPAVDHTPPARAGVAVAVRQRLVADACGRERPAFPEVLEGVSAGGDVVWEQPAMGLRVILTVADGDALVYVHDGTSGFARRVAVDGRVRWARRWPEGASPGPLPDPSALLALAEDDESLFLAFAEPGPNGTTQGLDLWTLDAGDGAPRARRRVASAGQLDVAFGPRGTIYAAEQADARLHVLDPSGAVLATGPIGAVPADPAYDAAGTWSHVTTMADGRDVVVARDRVSVRDDAGREAWAFGTADIIAGVVADPGGGLVLATSGCELIALDAEGGLAWTHVMRGPFTSCPAPDGATMVADGAVLLVQWADGERGAVVGTTSQGAPIFAESVAAGARLAPVLEGGRALLRRCADGGAEAELPPLRTRGPAADPRRDLVQEVEVEQLATVAVDALAVRGPRRAAAILDGRVHQWDGEALRPLVAALPPAATPRDPDVVLRPFVPRGLVADPGGALWIAGTRRADLVESPYGAGFPASAGELTLLLREERGRLADHPHLRAMLSASYDGGPDHPVHVAPLPRGAVVCHQATCWRVDGDRVAPIALPDGWHASAVATVGAEVWALGPRLARVVGDRVVETDVPIAEAHGALPRLWGSGPADVWIVDGAVRRFDGRRAVEHRVPVARPHDVWGSAADDVWIVGDDGAAHFDGQRWARVVGLGAPRLLHIGGAGRDAVWMGGPSGLLRVAARRRRHEPTAARAGGAARETVEVLRPEHGAPLPLVRVTLRPPGRAPVDSALELAARGGALWVRDDDGVTELVAQRAVTRASREDLGGWSCRQCLAPEGPGKGVVLGAGSAFALDAAGPRRLEPRLASMMSISHGRSGLLVGGGPTPRSEPSALALDRRAHAWDVPRGCFVAADASGADGWLAGGLSCGVDRGGGPWPAGEGLLVQRVAAGGVRAFRAPAGPLLDVVGVGPDEAWAVGVDGAIVHVRAGAARRLRLDPAVRLHAVAARDGEVWIAGDDRTLVRLRGDRAERVEVDALPPRSSITSLAFVGATLWAASADGLLRAR